MIALVTVACLRWIPAILWRIRLERIISAKIEGDAPGDREVWMNPIFQLYNSLTGPELDDVRRDPARVVDRLLASIETASVPEFRRQKVLRSLEIYLDETEREELIRRAISRGVGMLSSGKLPFGLETDLAFVIAERYRSVGIENADRIRFRDRARVVLSSSLPHPNYAKVWALSLARLGGLEELRIIRGHGTASMKADVRRWLSLGLRRNDGFGR